jgi:hypothetical protein
VATSTDPSLALIQTLDWQIQLLAVDLVNAARTAPLWLPLVITSARRSSAEQARLVQQGRSRTLASRHVLGLAFDVDMLHWNRDAVPRWVWDRLGPLGESIGLTWGGRWTSFLDVGHFEI